MTRVRVPRSPHPRRASFFESPGAPEFFFGTRAHFATYVWAKTRRLDTQRKAVDAEDRQRLRFGYGDNQTREAGDLGAVRMTDNQADA